MSDKQPTLNSSLSTLAGFAESGKTVLKRRLQEFVAHPDDASALPRLRRAARETELWLSQLEHLQCVQLGAKLPASSTLGTIAKFRCRLDAAVGRQQRPGTSERLKEQAQTMLARLSPPSADDIFVSPPAAL